MKPFLKFTLLAALILNAGKSFATNEVLTVAVFDFESKDEAVRDLGPKISTLLNANLSANPDIITVERAGSVETIDLAPFRALADKTYTDADLTKAWNAGLLKRIGDIK